jgi:putative glutamate/gamma-aminobutyrate antiporter
MNKKLSVFMLAMINLAAMGSIRSWPSIAEYGFSSLFLLLFAAIVFFIPSSLVSAELATGWPRLGGVFVWVKEAFGHRTGFLAVWLLWIENVIWYPTILSFIAASLAYLISPGLLENRFYMLTVILSVYWVTTWINMKGMRASGWISSVGMIFGLFLPAAFIIGFGIDWVMSGHPIQVTFDFNHFIPDLSSPNALVFFTGIMFAFCGIEMSAIHARDVINPQKSYPKAILLSAILLLGLLILGVLSIAIVIPQTQISLTAGAIQAMAVLVAPYNAPFLLPFFAILIVIGAIASLSTWILGPSRGLLAAAESGDLPPAMRKLNKYGMPYVLMTTQATIVSLISFMFILMPTLNSAYWIITVLSSQLYLLMYLLMFAAAIKLRYKRPNIERAYRVPGGKAGMWVVAGMGFLSSLFALVIGYFPPAQILTGSSTFYVNFLIVATLAASLAPWIILHFKKPSWSKQLSHEGKE